MTEAAVPEKIAEAATQCLSLLTVGDGQGEIVQATLKIQRLVAKNVAKGEALIDQLAVVKPNDARGESGIRIHEFPRGDMASSPIVAVSGADIVDPVILCHRIGRAFPRHEKIGIVGGGNFPSFSGGLERAVGAGFAVRVIVGAIKARAVLQHFIALQSTSTEGEQLAQFFHQKGAGSGGVVAELHAFVAAVAHGVGDGGVIPSARADWVAAHILAGVRKDIALEVRQVEIGPADFEKEYDAHAHRFAFADGGLEFIVSAEQRIRVNERDVAILSTVVVTDEVNGANTVREAFGGDRGQIGVAVAGIAFGRIHLQSEPRIHLIDPSGERLGLEPGLAPVRVEFRGGVPITAIGTDRCRGQGDAGAGRDEGIECATENKTCRASRQLGGLGIVTEVQAVDVARFQFGNPRREETRSNLVLAKVETLLGIIEGKETGAVGVVVGNRIFKPPVTGAGVEPCIKADAVTEAAAHIEVFELERFLSLGLAKTSEARSPDLLDDMVGTIVDDDGEECRAVAGQFDHQSGGDGQHSGLVGVEGIVAEREFARAVEMGFREGLIHGVRGVAAVAGNRDEQPETSLEGGVGDDMPVRGLDPKTNHRPGGGIEREFEMFVGEGDRVHGNRDRVEAFQKPSNCSTAPAMSSLPRAL